ncbi:RcnB family protein [Novosphingobium sp. FKTRR1]|uniref:RcnB family protein n=1 Tax=Novosphingobium sp. FKTRR1 TaxID=2879118 RepID=UPI001CF030F8|nr:RcnB family protein [Novosphingobium sp. FKTRR1]
MTRPTHYLAASAVLALSLTFAMVTPALVAAQPAQSGNHNGGQNQDRGQNRDRGPVPGNQPGGYRQPQQVPQPPQPRQQQPQAPQPQAPQQQPERAQQPAQPRTRPAQTPQQRWQTQPGTPARAVAPGPRKQPQDGPNWQQRAGQPARMPAPMRTQPQRDRTVQRWTQPLPAPTRPAARTAAVQQMRRNVQVKHRFHAGTYQRPQGYARHRWGFGQRLPRSYYARNYWIGDYLMFSLFAPPAGLVWVRVGRDAFLIDRYDGEIIQARYRVFY